MTKIELNLDYLYPRHLAALIAALAEAADDMNYLNPWLYTENEDTCYKIADFLREHCLEDWEEDWEEVLLAAGLEHFLIIYKGDRKV